MRSGDVIQIFDPAEQKGLSAVLGERIGTGNRAAVFRVIGAPEMRFWAAKLFTKEVPADLEWRVSLARERNLGRIRRWTRAGDDDDDVRIVAAPEFLVVDGSRPVGVLMPVLPASYRQLEKSITPAVPGGVPLELRLRAATSIAHIVDQVHAAGAFIGDFTPKNTMMDKRGDIALVDVDAFGYLDRSSKSVIVRSDGITPSYRAPEMRTGHADQRSDLFALGQLVMTLLLRWDPFHGVYGDDSSRQSNIDAGRTWLRPQPDLVLPASVASPGLSALPASFGAFVDAALVSRHGPGRPAARAWREVLEIAGKDIMTGPCGHLRFRSAAECIVCGQRVRTAPRATASATATATESKTRATTPAARTETAPSAKATTAPSRPAQTPPQTLRPAQTTPTGATRLASTASSSGPTRAPRTTSSIPPQRTTPRPTAATPPELKKKFPSSVLVISVIIFVLIVSLTAILSNGDNAATATATATTTATAAAVEPFVIAQDQCAGVKDGVTGPILDGSIVSCDDPLAAVRVLTVGAGLMHATIRAVNQAEGCDQLQFEGRGVSLCATAEYVPGQCRELKKSDDGSLRLRLPIVGCDAVAPEGDTVVRLDPTPPATCEWVVTRADASKLCLITVNGVLS
ncbi:hypothetical protein [Rathayibacter sp. AY1B8]|uniref:protein kinase domain-containing protein n=1 Tax=Rathayibacter sp. AY1B8 TaxID=2080533 RepID=UPI0015E3927D|nr:hypothetical protein [Rathayibacter sp. AY1B8]